ncbi:hypothetical protein PF003_g40177 [Phytophthora fragariae]|nr:hypothetical protein PF003_g40177 [Phytophthora fragariae]
MLLKRRTRTALVFAHNFIYIVATRRTPTSGTSSRRKALVALSDSLGVGAESDDSDMLFEFDDGPHPRATSTASASMRRDFVLVGVLTSFAAAQREMSERDDYVHTYETRYETDRLFMHMSMC